MLRRFQQMLNTAFHPGPADKAAQAAILFSEEVARPERPPLQLPASLAAPPKPEPVTSLPPLPRPMAPLQSEFFKAASLKAAPVRVSPPPVRAVSQAPSLAEICAEQAPTPLLKTLHEQARWFYEYRPAAPSFSSSAVFTPIIRCTPLPGLLDYQRVQIFVESAQDEHISLDLEVAEQADALILIGDVQPGQYSGCRLRVPTNREIEVCFRIFATQDQSREQNREKSSTKETSEKIKNTLKNALKYALKLSPVEPESKLEPVLSEACFGAESQLATV